MAGVDVYDPERQNENQRLDNNIDNDDDNGTTTTSLQSEVFQEPVTDASLRARLNALRDMQDALDKGQISTVGNVEPSLLPQRSNLYMTQSGF